MRELVGYANADGSMAKDRWVMLGYAFVVDGGAVSWSTKQQEIILLSMMESEYIAVTHTAKEAAGTLSIWLMPKRKSRSDRDVTGRQYFSCRIFSVPFFIYFSFLAFPSCLSFHVTCLT